MDVGRIVKRLGALLSLVFIAALSAGGCAEGLPRITSPSYNVPFTQTDTVVGTGNTAQTGHLVVVSYTGWLYDPNKPNNRGKQFDSAPTFGFTLGLGSVIEGWDEGIPGMKVGGTRVLTIPPDKAYGD